MTNNQIRILIIDDENPIREILSASIRDEGYQVHTAPDGEQGLKAMADFSPDICFLDIWMPGAMDGLEVLRVARQKFPEIHFVMMSGHGTIETAVKATKLGAWDFIEKPLSMDKIFINISNLISVKQEKQDKQALLNKLRKNIAMIGDSAKMMELKKHIAQCAGTVNPVMITGEIGSGRFLTAQNIHFLSARASRPFVDIQCKSSPDDLIDGEIFGYDKGTIPGLTSVKKGKIELCDGGTLFLDDVCRLNLKSQAALLDYLKSRHFKRVGGVTPVPSDVRIITTTSENLSELVQKGLFLKELYEKISSVQITMPSLREHSDDIPALIMHFSDQFAREGGFIRKEISTSAYKTMISYKWPGNVRELRNFIERLYILSPTEFIDVYDLNFAGLVDSEAAQDNKSMQMMLHNFRDARAQFEKEYILKKLAENNNNISRTAEVIGLERSYLHRKMKAYQIEIE